MANNKKYYACVTNPHSALTVERLMAAGLNNLTWEPRLPCGHFENRSQGSFTVWLSEFMRQRKREINITNTPWKSGGKLLNTCKILGFGIQTYRPPENHKAV